MIPGRRTISGDMLKSVYDKNNNGIVDNAEKVNGFTVDINVPSNAKFTDTIYDDTEIQGDISQLQTDVANKVDKITGKGLSTNDFTTTLKNKLDGIDDNANYYTLPTATASTLGGVKIGSNITLSSGTISISKTNIVDALGYTPPTTNTTYDVATQSANGLMSSADKLKLDTKVPVLDNNGLIPTSVLPSYVDDVLEYANKSSFPTTGETGKIYVDTSTNKTYRWGGSDYVEISASLALGTTSSTAYRGDYGNAAYIHGVTNKGSAFANGLYKITTNSEGHVTAATAVVKSDITDLGIPGSEFTGGTLDNNLILNNTNNGNKYLGIRRNTADTELVKHYIEDSAYNLYYTNDEAASYIKFIMKNTDTEQGGGASANTNTIRFYSDINGTQIEADTFTGNSSSSTVSTTSTITNLEPTTGTWYYPTWVTDTTGNLGLNTNDGLKFYSLQGTTAADGHSYLQVGNGVASGTAGNKQGHIRIYSKSSGYADIVNANTTSNRTHTLPNSTGTILNTGTTSFTQTVTSGTELAQIKINGTTKSIYVPYNILKGTTAPTSADGNDGDIFILYE